jgi:uncharacterized protein YbjT (DUF2867 family)
MLPGARGRATNGAARGAILLTGASGYVGGRLLPRLEARGLAVRCLARRPELLARRVGPRTQVVPGDALRAETLAPALEGVDAAYYLIHSMDSAERTGFEAQDRLAAANFGRAARAAGLRRIVYLGGLGEEGDELSPHLRSRHEVGRVLRDSGVPVIELRASIVIGSGSLSFEMIRALVERLPVLVTPRWVRVVAQPIAIDDLLAYLEAALELETDESRVYEIGGAERLSYQELMREYARARGLRRVVIPVPVLTPWLSSLWLALVTPLYARVGRKLIESIVHETVVRDDRARRDFPIEPMGAREAVARAIAGADRRAAGSVRGAGLLLPRPAERAQGVHRGDEAAAGEDEPQEAEGDEAEHAVRGARAEHEVREEHEERHVHARRGEPLDALTPRARVHGGDHEPERDEQRRGAPADEGDRAHGAAGPDPAASSPRRCSSTRPASWSGVKPKKRARSASGADAPKRSIP